MATTDFTVARNGFILSAKEQQQRFIIKNLMYYTGIDKAEYTRRFGESLDRIPLFRELAEQHWQIFRTLRSHAEQEAGAYMFLHIKHFGEELKRYVTETEQAKAVPQEREERRLS